MNVQALHIDELAYRVDCTVLFECIRDLPGAALLDSSRPHCERGRYDIMTAEPLSPEPPALAPGASEAKCLHHFSELAAYLRDRFGERRPASADIPFSGGLLGVLGYDSGFGLNALPAGPRPRCNAIGGSHLQAYDWCVIQDHTLRRSVLVTQPGVTARKRRDLLARLRRAQSRRHGTFQLRTPFTADMSADEYRRAFARTEDYIRSGDCYQINLAQRFSAHYDGDPWFAYLALRPAAAAPFAGYLSLPGNASVLSVSPERFLSVHGRRVETMPIKGTRPRHPDPETDRRIAAELLRSPKDRAENLMIVDLLRNDLGRSCVPGSIQVDKLFELQSFATVHHLVSEISGELAPGRDALDVLRDSFPGGSITGAPKRRAMQIIDELEPQARQIYCGSLLYLSTDGRMDSSIAIRTLLCENDTIRCWGGGGIVADSQCQQEYQETYDKVGRLLQVLESL